MSLRQLVTHPGLTWGVSGGKGWPTSCITVAAMFVKAILYTSDWLRLSESCVLVLELELVLEPSDE